jgi:hypothetical protein
MFVERFLWKCDVKQLCTLTLWPVSNVPPVVYVTNVVSCDRPAAVAWSSAAYLPHRRLSSDTNIGCACDSTVCDAAAAAKSSGLHYQLEFWKEGSRQLAAAGAARPSIRPTHFSHGVEFQKEV